MLSHYPEMPFGRAISLFAGISPEKNSHETACTPNSLHPGEILANSLLIFAETAATSPIWLRTKLERGPLDFNLPAFYVFFLWTLWV